MEIIIILRFKQTHRPTSFLCFFNLSKFSSYYNTHTHTHTHTPHDQSSTHICYTISHLYGSQVIFFHCWSSKHAILHLSTSLYNTPWNRESLCMINPLPRGPINTLEVTWDLSLIPEAPHVNIVSIYSKIQLTLLLPHWRVPLAAVLPALGPWTPRSCSPPQPSCATRGWGRVQFGGRGQCLWAYLT